MGLYNLKIMIDLTKHEWQGFTADHMPDPEVSRTILILDQENRMELCEIYSYEGKVQVIKYDLKTGDYETIRSTSKQLSNLRWDYIKV